MANLNLKAVKRLAYEIARNTWLDTDGSKPIKATLSLLDAEPVMYLEGDIIEPMYEAFEPVCNIYAVDDNGICTPLMVTESRNVGSYHNESVVTGGWDAVKDYIDGLSGVLVTCDTLELR